MRILQVLMIIVLMFAPGWRVAAVQQQSVAEQHWRAASEHFNQRRFAEAAAEARLAREANPALIGPWKLEGIALQLAQRYGEAAQTFTLALKEFPKDADLWFYLARVEYLQSSLKAAERAARQALQLKPQHADAHMQLGMILEALHDYTGALESFRKSAELNRREGREQALTLVYAGNLLLKIGRATEAVESFSRAVEIEPRAAEIRIAHGRALEQAGRVREAEEEYRLALKLEGGAQAQGHLERLKAGAATAGVKVEKKPMEKAAVAASPIRFRNVARQAGVDFMLRNSAASRKYQIEPMTGGVAVLDYDNDGWDDIFFVNGAELPSMQKTSPQFWNRLYRNNHDGTFKDVTAAAGVAGLGYAMGVAVADYDNDGDADIFVAGVNRNQLLRNDGGKFRDVTIEAKLTGVDDATKEKPWSVSAAWFDYDNDGRLDLFVVNYCKWRPELDPYCGDASRNLRTYCYPDKYEGLPNQLFHNNGDGTFTDVSKASGIARHVGKGMGVAIADYNDDGFIDVFVANDTLPNFLFRNSGRGGFEEVALRAGVALNDYGRPVSSMGVDFRDYDNDGRVDVIVSALEGETYPLWRSLGEGLFADVTYPSGLGLETIKRSGWSLGMYDFNNDGWKDLFTANAHVNDNIEQINEQTYRQPNSIFANVGGAFQDVSRAAGEDFQVRQAHRGAAFGDFNNDGRMDVVTTSLNEPAELFLNESASGHWLSLRLVGTRSSRDAVGARVKIITADGRAQFNHVTTSVGYASSSTPKVYFGLSEETVVKLIEIRWPSGVVQTLKDVKVDQLLTVTESLK